MEFRDIPALVYVIILAIILIVVFFGMIYPTMCKAGVTLLCGL